MARGKEALRLHDARVLLAGGALEGLPGDGARALREVAHWLEDYVSRPHPGLGRSGEVCPWTRRTIDLGQLMLVAIESTDAAEVDTLVLALLEQFVSGEAGSGPDLGFRSIVAVFHGLGSGTAAEFVVAAHARLKPAFLDRRLMLGEFYPTCEKPGLRSPTFRPLRSPAPLLVIRQMVEADIEFLLDRNEFVEAYLRTHRSRGLERLLRVLEQRPASVPPERAAELARFAAEQGALRTRRSAPP